MGSRLRAVLYARVSSTQQRDAHTVESQLRTLPAYVKAQGWELVRPPATYVDDGRTAKAGHLGARTAFRRLLDDAEAGLFEIVAVVDIDRLSRSEDLGERGEIYGRLQRAGVRIATPSMGLVDLRTFLGDMWVSVQAVVAAEENRKRSERALRARELSVARGRKPAGATPYGYTYDMESGAWGIDPVTGEVVREIYRRLVAGDSGRAIALDLERRGVPSPRGGRWKESVRRIAMRSTYRGVHVADRGRGQTIAVPAIVDDTTWFAAQEALAVPALRGRPHAPRRIYLCAGLSVCGLCGGRCWVFSESDARIYYACSRRRLPPGGERCELPMRRTYQVDDRIWFALSRLLLRPDLVAIVTGRRASRARTDPAALRAELARIVDAELAILDRFGRGLISEPAMDAAVKRVAAERARLQERLRAAEGEGGGRASPEAFAAALGALRELARDAGPEERRDLVRTLIPGRGEHVVTIGPDDAVTARIRLPVPCQSSAGSPQKVAISQGGFALSLPLVA